MKQFLTVFKFELLGQLKNKIAIVITAVIVIGLALVLSYPRFNIEPLEDKHLKEVALVNSSSMSDEVLKPAFENAFSKEAGYNLTFLVPEDELKTLVLNDEYDAIIEIIGPTSINYVVKTVGLYDYETSIASETLKSLYQYNTLAEMGLSEEEVNQFFSSNIDVNTIVTGKDQTTSFWYTYVIVMILYFVLLIYGQFVATSVAGEKSSRAMEVLITSAKPMNLMFGKVLGSGCAGLIELLIILGSAIGFYKLNEDVITNDIVSSVFGIPTYVALMTILFFILGYFIFAFMYGAAGSLASRTEDISALVMPVMVLFMITFFVAIIGMNNGSVDELYFKVLSFLPTFSSMLMLVRICMGEVATWEIILSVVIQLISILGLGVLCSRIYRAGILMYGNTPKPKDIWRIITSEAK
ncbi:MAG: ABC transporter permease [Oscillospiraceae bacterium]|nr:ABC transporter permease [Candidatus Limimonas coprohippi]